MRKIIALSFLVLFLLASFNQLSILGVYILSQDFITEKFCVNKDKPVMQCKGKCHLNDIMLQVEDQQTPDNHFSASTFFLPVFYEVADLDFPSPAALTSMEFQHTEKLFSSYSGRVFHPPRVV